MISNKEHVICNVKGEPYVYEHDTQTHDLKFVATLQDLVDVWRLGMSEDTS